MTKLYCGLDKTLNLDSARQSPMEAQRSERRSPASSGQGEKEGRFGEVAASPNSKFHPGRSITLESRSIYTSGLFRAFLCIGTIGALLYAYIDVQNEITKRRLDIPLLAQELREIKEKNTCLHYEIDLFESPEHLMELASRSEYAHLKQPMLKDVLAFQEAKALDFQNTQNKDPLSQAPSSSLLVGAKQ